ncbi:hypothetical protein IAQ61_009573 [Plenodomus lingam]|uniref:uncharacterized protein n=1 Tax=Leptosphaeria maculans TaxID=5022 RepID=UPI0033187067|nr:hypothetical protein IAQ61_009573 [Plenodomus lingam]
MASYSESWLLHGFLPPLSCGTLRSDSSTSSFFREEQASENLENRLEELDCRSAVCDCDDAWLDWEECIGIDQRLSISMIAMCKREGFAAE